MPLKVERPAREQQDTVEAVLITTPSISKDVTRIGHKDALTGSHREGTASTAQSRVPAEKQNYTDETTGAKVTLTSR